MSEANGYVNDSNGLINKFLHLKTIQKPFNFYVDIYNSYPQPDLFSNQADMKEFESSTETTFPVKPWHIKSITLPHPATKIEIQRIGTFVQRHPMFDFESQILKIDFMEDAAHTIGKFIMWCNKRRMNADGYYFPLEESACLNMNVNILSDDGSENVVYQFNSCSLTNSSEATYAYDGADAISHSLDFVFESVTMYKN